MPSSSSQHRPARDEYRDPYRGIGDKCGLSAKTVRNAFSRKPVTWQTAMRIANAIGIDMGDFRIKVDSRGRKK